MRVARRLSQGSNCGLPSGRTRDAPNLRVVDSRTRVCAKNNTLHKGNGQPFQMTTGVLELLPRLGVSTFGTCKGEPAHNRATMLPQFRKGKWWQSNRRQTAFVLKSSLSQVCSGSDRRATDQRYRKGPTMKKLLLAGAAVAGLLAAGAASAADLPSRRMAPAPMAPAFAPLPVFTWTGFYIGANVGYAWNNNDNDSFVPNAFVRDNAGRLVPFTGTFDRGDSDGFLAGVHTGYNMQFGGFVLGVEGDIEGV